MKKMFRINKPNEEGVWSVYFYGVGKEIVMDDYLPVTPDGQLMGASSKKDEMWVPIIEKAYAKYMGSYGKILNGTSHQAMRNLLGFSGEELSLQNLNKTTVGDLMLECYVKGYPMTCDFNDGPQQGKDDVKTYKVKGLV